MPTSQTETQSQIIDLSAEAFETFCEDILGMFNVDMKCDQQAFCAETVEGLEKRFKKLVAVNSVKAEGALDGTFQLVFDQDGLFTLAGVIVMLPEQEILQNRRSGSAKDAEDMNDALAEAGNLLVGSWDRVFREELDGHGHFIQTNTFIGNPWDNPEEKIGLSCDGEFLFVPYEMTIGSYPSFSCGAIVPKTLFRDTSESDTEQVALTEEKAQDQEVAVEKTDSEESNAPQKSDSEDSKPQEATAEELPAEQTPAQEDTEAVTEETIETEQEAASAEKEPETQKAVDEEHSTAKGESEADDDAKTDTPQTLTSDNAVEPEPSEIGEPAGQTESAAGDVSETIQKMAQSPADLPGEHSLAFLTICAKDTMQKEVIWGSGDDSVQQALAKMQQADTGYMLVGTDGVLDGIVSKSDITGAVSVYLRPVFAKWHGSLDDATLQIKVKWIMSRPVRTIKPETSLGEIMENMGRFAGRCLPVIDQQGRVQGLVTVFDIFNTLLKSHPHISTAGKTPQAPPLT